MGRSPDIPPGWTDDPSAWNQRLPIVGAALIGFGIAGYLSLFQLGVIDEVWEPLFGDGSRVILTSGVSHVLPVPDAALGAFGYLVDAVTGAIGGRARWRTMPWIVIVFGLAVGPLGAVSILLVVLQPVLYDAFCTLCLASAVISLVMIGPAMDELLAALQHVRRARDAGAGFWEAFVGTGKAEEALRRPVVPPERKRIGTAWPNAVAAAIGLWLMAAPAVLGHAGTALATSDRIVGPVVASLGVIALWEVTRTVRWGLLPLSAWLMVAPVVLGAEGFGLASNLASGLALLFLLLPGRNPGRALGGGWSSLWGRERATVRPGSGFG